MPPRPRHDQSAAFRRQRMIIAAVAALMVGFGVGVPLVRHLTAPGIVGGPPRPLAYQVLYRTAAAAQGNRATNGWELLTVDRPFEASDLSYRSRPDTGAAPEGGAAFSADRLYAYADGGLRAISGRPPGPPGYDQDLLTQMPDLERRGLARALDRSEQWAGRTCAVYRLLEPPSGAIRALSGSDHDDLCLDRDGLVLSEAWTLKGRVVELRRAAEVRVGPVAQPVTPASSAVKGRGVAQARPDPSARSFLPDPVRPPGFRAWPAESVTVPDPSGNGAILAVEVVWAFTDGPNTITVEAGTSSAGQLPWQNEPTATTTVRLGGLGPATSALRSDGAELRVALGDGQWVRIRGTVPLSGLIRYADGLRPPA